MRRNRQKVHHQLRLRAETRKAAARALRVRRRAEQQRHQAAMVAACKRRAVLAVPEGRFAARWPGIEHLLKLAPVDAVTLSKVRRLCQVLADVLPDRVTCDQLPWLLLLALPSWARDVDRFRAPSGSVRRKREALVVHLFGRYRVPPFLLRALDAVDPLPVARVPVEDRWAVEVLAHVGRGGSLRDLAGSDAFPAPLTRRMCHVFLETAVAATPILALRRAQVLGVDGPEALAARLVATRLGALQGPDPIAGEPFWQAVIGWLCRHPGLHREPASVLDDLFGWAVDQSRSADQAARSFRLEGRTDASVLREVRLWRAARALDQDPTALPDSGIPAFARDDWTVTPITSRKALWEEGQAMHHCVAMYVGLARKHKVAVFSLRRAGARVATLEVALGAGAVVQAKGLANRALHPSEAAVVREWAAQARLAVRA